MGPASRSLAARRHGAPFSRSEGRGSEQALLLSSHARGHGGLSVREEAITHGGPDMRPPLLLRGWQAPCSNSASGGRGATRCCTATGDRRGNRCRRGRVPGRRSADGGRTGLRRPPTGRSAGAADGPDWVLCELGRQLLSGWAPECRSTVIGHVRPRRLDPQPHTTDQHAARTTPARHHHSPGWMQHARHSLSASSSTLAARTAAQRRRDPRARSWDGGRSGQRRPSSAPAGRRATPASQAAAGRRSSGGMAGGA